MNDERTAATVEELSEVETLAELHALWVQGREDDPATLDCQPVCDAIKDAWNRLAELARCQVPVQPSVAELQKKVAELEALLMGPKQPRPKIKRAPARYVLMSTDVGWSTKPQVHALMEILKANVQVGQVFNDDEAVEMAVANEVLLSRTTQGGERVWDYYKGNSNEGLMAHGNIVKVQ